MSDDILPHLINNRGVITTLLGGLGNQMFEIAAGYALALRHNLVLYVTQRKNRIGVNNKHNFNNNNYKNTIFIYFFNTNIKSIPFNKYNLLINNGYLYAKERNIPDSINSGIIIEGRFQDYTLFSKYEIEIRNLFLKGLEKHIERMKIKYNTENTAFLHIRRGDYLLCKGIFKQPDKMYYIKCIRRLKKRNINLTKIFIFTNDLRYARSIPFFKKPLFKIINEPDELDSLALMSLCNAGAIITNSTFGWWGAFLGAHQLRNPVYAFKQWLMTAPTPNLCPRNWIIL
jgi:hypothetical protein